jgi:hypothetical protein
VTTATVYVELAGEGVRVWRPVEAEGLGDGRYRLVVRDDYDQRVETRAFAPGSVVRCKQLDLGDGLVPEAIKADEAASA